MFHGGELQGSSNLTKVGLSLSCLETVVVLRLIGLRGNKKTEFETSLG